MVDIGFQWREILKTKSSNPKIVSLNQRILLTETSVYV